jgi:ATPase subunit of ABC transporter with duplicated ATPase domains
VQERLRSENSKKSVIIADLQQFVSRFSANASKAKQATSRAKKLEKIKLDDIKPSSRMNPFIRFNQDKKLHRQAVTFENLGHGFDGETLFEKSDIIIEAGERIAVIGENGAGKTTLLRCMMGHLTPRHGRIKWAENANLGYCPQDTGAEFVNNTNLFDWMSLWRKPNHDDQIVRATLGRLLFSADEYKKKARVCSGGEKNRLLFGKLMMMDTNVLVMDEPTNHLDMESIESLNLALENYPGTLIFVSHDREFVSSLATQIIEIKGKELINFKGTYTDYLASQALK